MSILNATIPVNYSGSIMSLGTNAYNFVDIDTCRAWCHNTQLQMSFYPAFWFVGLAIAYMISDYLIENKWDITYKGKTVNLGKIMKNNFHVFLIAGFIHMVIMIIFKRA